MSQGKLVLGMFLAFFSLKNEKNLLNLFITSILSNTVNMNRSFNHNFTINNEITNNTLQY